jgi:hypothetical protein
MSATDRRVQKMLSNAYGKLGNDIKNSGDLKKTKKKNKFKTSRQNLKKNNNK